MVDNKSAFFELGNGLAFNRQQATTKQTSIKIPGIMWRHKPALSWFVSYGTFRWNQVRGKIIEAWTKG